MGGGARAAYQVGVLDAVRDILIERGWPPHRNPFPIICGTSAGAINAVSLAAASDRFDEAVDTMVGVWSNFQASQVYRTDTLGALKNAAHWLGALALGWLIRSRPRSMFDNQPLSELLTGLIDFSRLQRVLDEGALQALAVTASSYTSGQHVTFYQSAKPVDPWFRTQRVAAQSAIGLEHLLASSAIPFAFPAVSLRLDGRSEFFGDGSIRQTSPISPAIHLGADRVLVIGVGQLQQGTLRSEQTGAQFVYPSLAQIAGHAMSSIFLDALANDIERLNRINRTLELIPETSRKESSLRKVEVLVISPSKRLDTMAAGHAHSLPRSVRTMLAMIGATDRRGLGLMSYLLFESGYTRDLIALGREDTFARREEVDAFFRGRTENVTGFSGLI